MEQATETSRQARPRRYAPLALAFGLLAIALRVVTLFAFPLTMDFDRAVGLTSLFGILGTIAALGGVAHAAIAGSKGERGPTLWIAWVLNVLAALGVPEPFVFIVG